MLLTGVIIATRIYDTWGRVEYLVALGALMAPLLLQVFLFFFVLGGLMGPCYSRSLIGP
jgi:hypothetical protein